MTGSAPRSTTVGSPMTAASAETDILAGKNNFGKATHAGRMQRPGRRSRYVRDPQSTVLTLGALRLLETVAAYRLVSLPQLVRLGGLPVKTAQRAMRTLFDAGWVEIVAVPRAALAEAGDPNDARLLFGSAPNIYIPTRAGIRLLEAHGLAEALDLPPNYGPKNGLLLRHELGVRDIRIFLELSAQRYPGQSVKLWRDGPDAAINLERTQAPKIVRPDAWFIYRIGQREGREAVLAAFVEYDRATERGERHWMDKLAAYRILFSGPRLREVTGYVNGRILVACPTAARREALADLIVRCAEPVLAERFWLAERSQLEVPDLAIPIWQRPGQRTPVPLVPASIAMACEGEVP